MFMSFVGRCWDTSKTSHGIWTWAYQVATRLQDFEAQITAQPPWQYRFFHGIWGSDVLGYLWLFQGSPSWWNGMNWGQTCVEMLPSQCSSCIWRNIDPKGMNMFFTSLFFGSIMDPQLFLLTSALFLNMSFDVGWQVGYQEKHPEG